MEWASREFVAVIYLLLPGFLAAWVFYGLTAHPKRDTFERVVQALIFTGIVQVLTTCLGWLLLQIGTRFFAIGTWTEKVAFGWSVGIGFVVGIVLSAAANRDTVHRWLRQGKWVKHLRITCRHSYPSEWFSAFQREQRWVILHLKDGRRLKGFPEEWPNHPDEGHFLLLWPRWVRKTGVDVPLPQVQRTIMPAEQVVWVEMLTEESERTMKPEEIETMQRPLVKLHETKKVSPVKENKDNGRRNLTTA